ncbi:hypothetical protein RvY_01599 [Ramazzottius varieornatus]|uniref:Uncharacterized protein n=1 Tax=Ramazzottius varieornatus TaxID=947166 RepID=A0A1D1UGX9_RAMVA|nr:hypothetical protein RvY_01599 [Ramazzottius varieornatus]
MSEYSAKKVSQDPERTDGGIFAGAEKYTKEDHPEYNVAYDPATGQQTGAGVPRTVNELRQRTDSKGKSGLGHESAAGGSGIMDDITRQAVIPAPAPSREHLLEAYPGMYPGLQKQIEQEERAKKLAEREDKMKEEVPTLEHTVRFKTDQEGHILSDEIEVHHKHGEGAHEHRGIKKQILHTLHLDRHDRKLSKEQNEAEEKDIKERMKELARISNRPSDEVTGIIEHYSQSLTEPEGADLHMSHRHGVPAKTTKVEETKATRHEGRDVGEQRTHKTETVEKTDSTLKEKAPLHGGGTTERNEASGGGNDKETLDLAMLNPEGVARKQREEELLRTGGNFMELDLTSHDESRISSDQIDNLIHIEKERKAHGLPVIDPFDPNNIKMNFHTADAFDAADKR